MSSDYIGIISIYTWQSMVFRDQYISTTEALFTVHIGILHN